MDESTFDEMVVYSANEWSHTDSVGRRLGVMDVGVGLELVLTSTNNTLESPVRPVRHQLGATSWPLQLKVRHRVSGQLPISGSIACGYYGIEKDYAMRSARRIPKADLSEIKK